MSALLKEARRTGLFLLLSTDAAYLANCESRTRLQFADLQKNMISGFHTQKGYSFDAIHPVLKKQIEKLGFEWNKGNLEELNASIKKINEELIRLDNPENKEDFLRIQIGMQGRKPFYLEMGDKSGIVHGLIAGATGTGKSSLLNTIIVKIAEQYSPEEVQLYLLDYKEGVEFFIYENHPNVKVLLLDNQNREFAQRKLEEFDQHIKKRSDAFIALSRQAGEVISDIRQYNRYADQRMPRLILLIDEFRHLFEGVNYKTRDYLDQIIARVAQQGRGFGLHLLFCSQSFNNVGWSASTKQQFELRIAFKVADANACASIMDHKNTTPITLSKQKHEIIYNTNYGNIDAVQKNQKVKTELFFQKADIPSILQMANENYEGIALGKEICRSNAHSKNNSASREQPVSEKNKSAKNKHKSFLDDYFKD